MEKKKTKTTKDKKVVKKEVKEIVSKKPVVEKIKPVKEKEEEIVAVLSEPETPDTLGGSKLTILKVEKIKVNGKEQNRITLSNGSVTVLDNEDFEAQKNQY